MPGTPRTSQRQQSKIVSAINALDADVVGLMEIENSLTLGETPDEATNSLVAALNADAGAGTWAANPSSTELPAGGMDVITNAIIYKPASVDRVGSPARSAPSATPARRSTTLASPSARSSRPTPAATRSCSSSTTSSRRARQVPNPGDADSGDGQGASNGSRELQAPHCATGWPGCRPRPV